MNFYDIRKAQHAGSWYDGSSSQLNQTLDSFMKEVSVQSKNSTGAASAAGAGAGAASAGNAPLRGLVGPHAGYSYSGPTAAYAYVPLEEALRKQTDVTTILVLHPSHHVYLDGCALSGASKIETPIGNLTVASDLREELWGTKQFSMMAKEEDEDEHSGEMHYPYIAKACLKAGVFDRIKVLPVMVGSIDNTKELHFGSVLKDIVARPSIITIVSTDFCHWGSRFRFQPTGSNEIFEHISEMDHAGMNHIELQEPGAFAHYLKQTRNTICGRHPLAVWLHAIRQNKDSGTETLNVQFVRYAQSSQVKRMSDSSVSYASAVATKA